MTIHELEQVPFVLDRVVTVNLWAPLPETNWEIRRDILINILQQEGFTNRVNQGVCIPLQEVVIDGHESGYNPLEELREALGFDKEHVHFFPLRENGKSGTAIITNMPVVRKEAYDIQKRTSPHDNIRNIGLMDIMHRDGTTLLGVTHLSYDKTQNYEVRRCIDSIRTYLLHGKELDADQKETLAQLIARGVVPQTSMLISGDWNANRQSYAFKRFRQEGFEDYTQALRLLGHNVSWPVNVDWLNAMSKNTLSYNLEELQRWMDYIFGIGLTPLGVRLLGTEPIEVNLGEGYPSKIYASDHKLPAVYFR